MYEYLYTCIHMLVVTISLWRCLVENAGHAILRNFGAGDVVGGETRGRNGTVTVGDIGLSNGRQSTMTLQRGVGFQRGNWNNLLGGRVRQCRRASANRNKINNTTACWWFGVAITIAAFICCNIADEVLMLWVLMLLIVATKRTGWGWLLFSC